MACYAINTLRRQHIKILKLAKMMLNRHSNPPRNHEVAAHIHIIVINLRRAAELFAQIKQQLWHAIYVLYKPG